MKKVWNAEENQFDYFPDEEAEQQSQPVTQAPSVGPKQAVEALRESIKPKAKGEGMTAAQRQAKWRGNHPEAHRAYQAEYMRDYRKGVRRKYVLDHTKLYRG
jgi:hypothetical protein